MWNMNFQILKLVLEKAEETEIKIPTSIGSSKKQESSRKASISVLLTMPKPLTMWITINCGKFWKRWEYQTTWPLNKKTLTPWKESYDQPRQHIKKQRHYFANKGPSSQGYGFSSGHVWMWELDNKESWAQKNWCFWTVVLEKASESPLDCKEIQPVHPEGNQSWMFIGRTDVEAETPVLSPPDVENCLIWKDLMLGEIEGKREMGMTEDEMAGWAGVWVNSWRWWWTGRPGVLRSIRLQSQTRLSYWTELNWWPGVLNSSCLLWLQFQWGWFSFHELPGVSRRWPWF